MVNHKWKDECVAGKIKCEVRSLLEDSQGSHDWDHTQRVCAVAARLAAAEGADTDLVALAALLHDIGRKEEDDANGEICHARRGAALARDILGRHGLPAAAVASVAHCIEAHRFRNECQPETIEAKVLFDADKLDAIGAVGIGRAFLFAGEIGARLHNAERDVATTEAYSREDTAYREFIVKLRNIHDRLLTASGKALAEARHRYMVAFFERLNREVSGEC